MDIERDYAFGIIPFYRESLGEYLFFIGRAQDRDGRQAFWKFPKGHKDSEDEEDVDAAIRELREETTIDLPSAAVIQSTSFTEEYFYERKVGNARGGDIVRKINTYYLGQVASSGSALPDVLIDENEFSEYRWAGFEEVFELLPENSQGMFRDANDFLVRHRA